MAPIKGAVVYREGILSVFTYACLYFNVRLKRILIKFAFI